MRKYNGDPTWETSSSVVMGVERDVPPAPNNRGPPFFTHQIRIIFAPGSDFWDHFHPGPDFPSTALMATSCPQGGCNNDTMEPVCTLVSTSIHVISILVALPLLLATSVTEKTMALIFKLYIFQFPTKHHFNFLHD